MNTTKNPPKDALLPDKNLPDYLAWALSKLPLTSDMFMLEVAAGNASLSFAIAPKIKSAIVYDASPRALKKVRTAAKKGKIENIAFQEGLAESLPYADNTFDLVLCQFAIHEFLDAEVAIKEMVRVGKSKSLVAIIDVIAPENKMLAESFNYFSHLVSPMHNRALTKNELQSVIKKTGLRILNTSNCEINLSVNDWLKFSHADKVTCEDIEAYLMRDIQGGIKTGLQPFLQNGHLMLTQQIAMIMSEKN